MHEVAVQTHLGQPTLNPTDGQSADQIKDQDHEQNSAEANASTAAVSPMPVTVIAPAYTEKQAQKYQEYKHAETARFRKAGKPRLFFSRLFYDFSASPTFF